MKREQRKTGSASRLRKPSSKLIATHPIGLFFVDPGDECFSPLAHLCLTSGGIHNYDIEGGDLTMLSQSLVDAAEVKVFLRGVKRDLVHLEKEAERLFEKVRRRVLKRGADGRRGLKPQLPRSQKDPGEKRKDR